MSAPWSTSNRMISACPAVAASIVAVQLPIGDRLG
jgi:hypothetical protein